MNATVGTLEYYTRGVQHGSFTNNLKKL